MSKGRSQATRGGIYEEFGANIARCRVAIGLSQSEVADRLQVPQSTYSGYESGTRKVPLSVIVQLSDFFGKTPDELISGEETSSSLSLELSPLDIQILDRFHSLSMGEQNMILRSLGIEEQNGGISD